MTLLDDLERALVELESACSVERYYGVRLIVPVLV